MKYTTLPKQLFIENRAKLAQRLRPNSMAVIHSNDMMPRNGDCFFPFRQNSDFFYLSGIDQEESVLLLYPDSPKADCKEVLFLKKTNEHIAIWEGHKYSKEEARATSGIDKIVWLDDMTLLFDQLAQFADTIYLNSNDNYRFQSAVEYRDMRLGKALKEKFFAHNFDRLQPILTDLRMIKSAAEIAVIQNACRITELAFRRVLDFVKPGVAEYEIEAEITHEFLRNRANGHAYTPIVASGRNACVLHYIDNNQICQDGDLLLMDFGAEYANYASDLTRTIPVNGRFSARQKQVYNAVLHVMKESTKLLKPGITLDEYHKEVGKIMSAQLVNIGLLDKHDVAKQDPQMPAYKKYFMHGTSHHLGLDVHDLNNWQVPIQAGMVFTVEPGIYILEENMGIRIENDVVVKPAGEPDDLMASIPREIEEIEELMNQLVNK